MTLCEVTYPSKFNEDPLTMKLMDEYIKCRLRSTALYFEISKMDKINTEEINELNRLLNFYDWTGDCVAEEFMRYLSFTIGSEEEIKEYMEKLEIRCDISKWDETTEIQYIPLK